MRKEEKTKKVYGCTDQNKSTKTTTEKKIYIRRTSLTNE